MPPSQPHIWLLYYLYDANVKKHALGLDILSGNLKPGAKVLDVGSGSGFMSACFAFMVGPSGHVYGVEHIKGKRLPIFLTKFRTG